MKKTSSKRKLNNRGFSLIELIVTLAIMVVLVAAAAVTVSMLDSSYVEDAERGIKDYISLGRTKSMSVSASDWYVTVGKEGKDYYVYLYKDVKKIVSDGGVDEEITETVLVEKKKIGTKISITYRVKMEQPAKAVTEEKGLEFHFDPATGKIVNVKCDGGYVASDYMASGIGYIGISRNDYEINLKVFFNTGKCERE